MRIFLIKFLSKGVTAILSWWSDWLLYIGWLKVWRYLCLTWKSHSTKLAQQDHTAEDSWTPWDSQQMLQVPFSMWTEFLCWCRHLKMKRHPVKKTQRLVTFMNLDIIFLPTVHAKYLLYAQLPNFRGHVWPSMGKSISLMGQSALIVSLTTRGQIVSIIHS